LPPSKPASYVEEDWMRFGMEWEAGYWLEAGAVPDECHGHPRRCRRPHAGRRRWLPGSPSGLMRTRRSSRRRLPRLRKDGPIDTWFEVSLLEGRPKHCFDSPLPEKVATTFQSSPAHPGLRGNLFHR
jgi:hypothetical protein